jgi:hypothetical protein
LKRQACRLGGVASFWAAALLAALPASGQQQGPINPQIPLAPPVAGEAVSTGNDALPDERQSRETGARPLQGVPGWADPVVWDPAGLFAAPPIPLPDLPERIAIPAETRIPIVLETPLSTRLSRRGQTVVFRTSGRLALGQGLEIPPQAEIRGRLVEVTRPGVFGKSGALRVAVERIVLLGGATSNLRAQLVSPDMNPRGRLTAEGRRSLNSQTLALLSLQGTLAGAQFGGKAAGIGAGAGAALAAVLMMSQKGRDVSVSVGTPFSLRLREGVDLPALAVFRAQQDYARTHPSRLSPEGLGASPDDDSRPVLRRRPATLQP